MQWEFRTWSPLHKRPNSPQIPASLNSYDAISRDHDSGIAGQGGIERGKARRPVDHGSRDDADSKALRDLSPQIINRQHAIATRGGQRPPRSFWPSPSCGPDCSETHSSMIVVVFVARTGNPNRFSWYFLVVVFFRRRDGILSPGSRVPDHAHIIGIIYLRIPRTL